MARIKLFIKKTGVLEIRDVLGAGADCVNRTARLERLAGGSDESKRQLKDEYYESTEQQQEVSGET